MAIVIYRDCGMLLLSENEKSAVHKDWDMKIKKTLILSGMIIAVVTVGLVSGNRLRNPLAGRLIAADKEIERLFKEMGILEISPTPVPEGIQLLDLVGNKITLPGYRGKIVFLNFWTTWCPPCRKEMPSMETLHQQLENENFVVLAVSIKESAKKVGTFFKKRKLSFPALLDPKGDAGKQFAIGQIPTTIILSKKGEIIGKALGPRHWGDATSIDLFRQLSRID